MGVSVFAPTRVSTITPTASVGATANPTHSTATPTLIPEMSVTITAMGVHVSIRFDGSFTLLDGDAFDIALFRDGVVLPGTARRLAFASGEGVLDPVASITMPFATQTIVVNETAGAHTYEARWARASGTARAYDTQRKLAVVEVPATVLA